MPKRVEGGSEYVIPSLRESQIQKAIVELLIAEHVFAIRLNTGTFRNSRGVPVSTHTGGPGVADLLTFPIVHYKDFRFPAVLWIEVKRPGGKQSIAQQSFQQRVEEEGHYYLLAFDVEDVKRWLKEHGVKQ